MGKVHRVVLISVRLMGEERGALGDKLGMDMDTGNLFVTSLLGIRQVFVVLMVPLSRTSVSMVAVLSLWLRQR